MTQEEKKAYILQQRQKGIPDTQILSELQSKKAITQEELSYGQKPADNSYGLVPGTREQQTYNGLLKGTLTPAETIDDQPYSEGGTEYSPGGFFKNIIKSGANLVGGVATALMNPIDTVQNIGTLAYGAADKGLQAIGLADEDNIKEGGFREKANTLAEGVGSFYKERYGGLDKTANTFYNDPLGALADLSTVLGIGGGALSIAGKAGKLGAVSKVGAVNSLEQASTLGKLSSRLSRAADLTDPFSVTGKVYKTLMDNGFTEKVLTPKQQKLVEGVDTYAKGVAAKGDNVMYEDILNPYVKMTDDELRAAKLTPEKIAKEQGKTFQELGDYKEAVMKSQADFNAPNPYTLVRQKAESALENLRSKLATERGPAIKTVLEGAAGDEVVPMGNILDDIRTKLSDKTGYDFMVSKGTGKVNPILTEVKRTGAKISPKEAEQIQNMISETVALGPNPTRRQVDAMVQKLDSMIKYGDSPASSVIQDIQGYLRKRADEGTMGGEYSAVDKSYGATKQLISDLEKGLQGEGNSYFMQVFNTAKGDARKELFSRIKSETGIDLTKQSVLAKIAVDAFGDTEQLSVLKELINAGAPVVTSGYGKYAFIQKAIGAVEKVGAEYLRKGEFKNAEDIIMAAEKAGSKLGTAEKTFLRKAVDSGVNLPDLISAWKKRGTEGIIEAVNNIKDPKARKAMQGLLFIEKSPVGRSRVNEAVQDSVGDEDIPSPFK